MIVNIHISTNQSLGFRASRFATRYFAVLVVRLFPDNAVTF